MANDLASRLYFTGASQIGSPSAGNRMPAPTNNTSYQAGRMPVPQMPQPQQKQEEEQQQGNTPNWNTIKRFMPQNGTSTGTASAAPQGGALVAGDIGSATYASNFGLAGAAQGLTYGAGTAASQGGLAAASQGLTYGGANAVAPAASQWGLGAASQGMTYGGATAASSAGSAGAASAGSSAAAGGASSGYGALMSNPWTAAAAAIIGHANYNHNKGISSWSDSLKGKAGGNMLDYYGGAKDGKNHGVIGKVFDKDRSVGKTAKSFTDLSELDFKNAWKNGIGGIKDAFKLKF